jgi:hypothetical protein
MMNGQVIKFQEVACTLWDVVAQFKKRANDAQADLLGAIQLRNEMFKEKEALLNEKEYWARERAFSFERRNSRESSMRARFAQIACSTLQARIASEVHDKKMLFAVILALFGVMVALLFGSS